LEVRVIGRRWRKFGLGNRDQDGFCHRPERTDDLLRRLTDEQIRAMASGPRGRKQRCSAHPGSHVDVVTAGVHAGMFRCVVFDVTVLA